MTAGFAKDNIQRAYNIMERKSEQEQGFVDCGLLVGGAQRLRGGVRGRLNLARITGKQFSTCFFF